MIYQTRFLLKYRMLGMQPRFSEIFPEPGKYEDFSGEKLVALPKVSVSKKGIQLTGWPFIPDSKRSWEFYSASKDDHPNNTEALALSADTS